MKFQEFKENFLSYVKLAKKEDEIYEKYPNSVKNFFLDDEYINSILFTKDFLVQLAFKEHTESVFWFVLENDFGKNGLSWVANDNPMQVNNQQDFLTVMKLSYVWDDE
jgi:hypothetical protein